MKVRSSKVAQVRGRSEPKPRIRYRASSALIWMSSITAGREGARRFWRRRIAADERTVSAIGCGEAVRRTGRAVHRLG